MFKETVKLFGLSAEQIAERLEKADTSRVDVEISEYCLDASLTMSSSATAEEFGRAKSSIYNLFEEEVYCSSDISMEILAAKLLKMNKRTLAVAESLTGGMICSRLASVPGISENLYEGVVCYDRRSKMDRLGVRRATLANYGAVSRQTAYEMVDGIAKAPADIGLATTGLAGPSGDEGKPVGLAYVGVGAGEFITVFEKRLSGSRNEIRTACANAALFYLIRYLKGDILRL